MFTINNSSINLRYNFLTFSSRDFMQGLFTQSYPQSAVKGCVHHKRVK
ncbi:type III restriction endonuclease subunit R [Helicobacter pylori]|nr:type III restriction endonuclease subunit R [Helicobacter pylori]